MRVVLYSFLLLFFFACQNNAQNLIAPVSDTAKILKIALQEGFSYRYMPDASALKRKFRFGDSIFLTSEVISLKALPVSISEQQFKLVPAKEICSTIRGYGMEEEPNYLIVKRVDKNDSGYYVQLQNLSCQPYGGGGSLGIYFKKIKDSFVIVHRSSTSIN
jgi:hypothetical protein